MKNNFLFIFVVSILLSLIYLPIVSQSIEINISNETFSSNKNTGGWIKEIDGVKIIHVQGSYYEMGFQYGSLLKEECMQLYRALYNKAEKNNLKYEELVERWNFIKQFIPIDHINELQGVADALDVPIEYVGAAQFSGGYNTPLKSRFLFMECLSFVGYGPVTADGKMYCGQSNDVPLWLQDPKTGVYVVQENLIVVIREPDDGHASININIAGYLGILGGMNDQGLVIGITGIETDDVNLSAIPTTIVIKTILDDYSTAEEAVDYIVENKKDGKTFIVSDCKKPISYAVEVSGSYSYFGTWDDPVESTDPFWSIDHVLRRVNLYQNQTLANTQRKAYKPNSFFSWLFGQNKYYPNWRHYKAVSSGIEDNWGKLDGTSMIKILRDIYTGKIDILFFFVTSLRIIETWFQYVVCPETGDMWFSLAGNGRSAFKNKVHQINLYDFLD